MRIRYTTSMKRRYADHATFYLDVVHASDSPGFSKGCRTAQFSCSLVHLVTSNFCARTLVEFSLICLLFICSSTSRVYSSNYFVKLVFGVQRHDAELASILNVC